MDLFVDLDRDGSVNLCKFFLLLVLFLKYNLEFGIFLLLAGQLFFELFNFINQHLLMIFL